MLERDEEEQGGAGATVIWEDACTRNRLKQGTGQEPGDQERRGSEIGNKVGLPERCDRDARTRLGKGRQGPLLGVLVIASLGRLAARLTVGWRISAISRRNGLKAVVP